MVNSVRLKNFKNHGDTEVALGRLTALVGPNSAGKTNVLQALRLMSQVIYHSNNTVFADRTSPELLVRQKEKDFLLSISGVAKEKEQEKQWKLKTFFAEEKHSTGMRWSPRTRWTWAGRLGNPITDRQVIPEPNVPEGLRRSLEPAVYLKLSSENLQRPSYTEQIPPRLAQDGSHLASVVAYLMTSAPKAFSKVQAALQAVVPSVKGVRTHPQSVRRVEKRFVNVDSKNVAYDEERDLTGQELLFDMKGAEGVPAHAVSEGTLLALGLLTQLRSPNRPSLVLLDDVGRGLHPSAQRELIAGLRTLVEERDDLQIVVTSHSPYVVDELAPESVWLLAADEKGVSNARRLSDHPGAERALEVLTTGEFWSAEGEEWVTKNRAVQ